MKGTTKTCALELPVRKIAAVFAVAILTAGAILSLPATAHGANAYGQTFAGQDKCLFCHNKDVPKVGVDYADTAHARFITPIFGNTAALVPDATKWPAPTVAGGYIFNMTDIGWMLGAPTADLLEYTTRYKNTGSYLLPSGQTLNAVAGPADDYMSTGSLEWEREIGGWASANVTPRPYFQSCGGCHFLGVTRPTDKTYTLGSGATVTHSTETSYSGMGIQCEICHGTGVADATAETGHWTSGTRIVRSKAALDSQVCGQCHVNGTAKEKNYLGSTFSGPNGYTPDRKLTDFYNVAAVQYVKTSPTAPDPVIPTNDTKVYPNGANKGMHHSYYNEWQLSAHARSLRWANGDLWTKGSAAEGYESDECLRCHSGEAFLATLDYGKEGVNEVYAGGSSLATDELDIECAVCHTIHAKDAKDGEALGLRMEGEELCGACHNSELEEGESAEPGQAVHHPQREMRNGYGLIGVATPAKRFMEDTACPACHMPKTRETRVSHRFLPMLPGNAETWKVQEFGDSCTPCHTSKSREALQEDIDTWAENLEELTAEATAAIDAAKLRGAAGTDGGKLLIDSATTNVNFVEADESHGAHNYPYAKAGLEKAAFYANSVGASFARFGATSYYSSMKLAMLYGTLAYGDGSPAAGERVTILARPGGESAWVKVGTATIGDDGDFGFAVGPTATTAYKVVWSPRSNVDIYSAEAKVAFGSSTSASVSSASLRKGSTTTISGAVSPSHSGKSVTIQYKKGSGSYRTLTTRTLSSSSAYSYKWRPSSTGTYYVRAVFAGDASHNGSTSVARKVVVR